MVLAPLARRAPTPPSPTQPNTPPPPPVPLKPHIGSRPHPNGSSLTQQSWFYRAQLTSFHPEQAALAIAGTLLHAPPVALAPKTGHRRMLRRRRQLLTWKTPRSTQYNSSETDITPLGVRHTRPGRWRPRAPRPDILTVSLAVDTLSPNAAYSPTQGSLGAASLLHLVHLPLTTPRTPEGAPSQSTQAHPHSRMCPRRTRNPPHSPLALITHA